MRNHSLSPEFPQANIVVNTVFFAIAGSTNAGLLLNQLYYWHNKGRNKDGWIYKTLVEWHQEIFLTKTEWIQARKELKGMGLLEEKRMGLNPVLHYRLNIDRLNKLGLEMSERLEDGIKPFKTQKIEKEATGSVKSHGWLKALSQNLCGSHSRKSATVSQEICDRDGMPIAPGIAGNLLQASQGIADGSISPIITPIITPINTSEETNNEGTPPEPACSLQALPPSSLSSPSPHQDFEFLEERKEEERAKALHQGLENGDQGLKSSPQLPPDINDHWFKTKAGKLLLNLMIEVGIDPKEWKNFVKYWGDRHNVANWNTNQDFHQLTTKEREVRVKSAFKRWAGKDDNLDDLIGDLECFLGRLALAQRRKEDAINPQYQEKIEEIVPVTQEQAKFILTRSNLWKEAQAIAKEANESFCQSVKDFTQQTLEVLGWDSLPPSLVAIDIN